MHVAIDASPTTRTRRTGTENYALQLIRHLVAIDVVNHYTLYFREDPPADLFPDVEDVHQRVLLFPRLWTHLRFAGDLWLRRPDLTFVPAHTLPRFFPGKAVVTIHDLGYKHFPDAHPVRERQYLDWSTRHSANRATMILADTHATRRDLIEFYDIPDEKIRVVYPGVDESLRPVKDEASLQAVRAKYGLPQRYLFFLSTLQPRKNVARLVRAFQQWHRDTSHTNVHLVLAGQKGWLYDESWTAGVENLIMPGYIHDEDIPALYSGALAFVFPSLFEGFGFGVVEAMQCETPVLTANTSSLPELAGDAALLVDPLDVDAIAQGIDHLVNGAALRKTLVERGKQQVKKFTWENTARQTLQVFEEVVRR
ncbi:MAG: glycosyltransferase family 4 protein [Chloroflexi bacterium]|nr:glycosyltransferase family 4 protein [Chloroflexota bacterium]